MKTSEQKRKEIFEKIDQWLEDSTEDFTWTMDWGLLSDECPLEILDENRTVSEIESGIKYHMLDCYATYECEGCNHVTDMIMEQLKPDIEELASIQKQEILQEFVERTDGNKFSNESIQELAEKYKNIYLENYYPIDNYVSDRTISDFDIEHFTKNTDVCLNAYFLGGGNSLEKETIEFGDALTSIYDLLDEWDFLESIEDTRDHLSNILGSPVLEELFKSQGYRIEDIFDENKVNTSKFLSSLKGEIENMSPQDYWGTERGILTACIRTSVWSYLHNIREDEENNDKYLLVINPNDKMRFGVFDPISGYSSELQIELEKPFKYLLSQIYIQLDKGNESCNHAVSGKIGGDESYWSEDFSFEEITK